ncbi:S49 family peptidase [Rhodobium gokarnense]|uniref:Signal peptide peptidase SppA n=1 Tax=Rhodobium gokarnense TaxID=364296 RepID=A0ABT3HCX5_9HYPH|nr:S49 family peptidase [Rhodobium gokarnense]MCW2308250.1 signal peptide peptidase SppA [Rhodobium gokarnense]
MFDWIRTRLPERWQKDHPFVPVVRLSGAIGMVTPLRPGLSLATCAPALSKAFSYKHAPAVAIIVNSPGGSPVQSRLIYQRIRDLAEEKEKQVFVFVEDVAASGGYMIALAGDEIVVDPSSIVGSIGVVAATFGFTEAMKKLGVERRVYTSGDRKVMLDPFQPADEEDVAHLKALQAEIHETFIDMVKERRGDILQDDVDLFNGRYWTGLQAQGFGLADKIGDLRGVLRERYGPEVKFKLVSSDRSFFMRRGARGATIAAGPDGVRLEASGLTGDLVSTLEERALWARYGL